MSYLLQLSVAALDAHHGMKLITRWMDVELTYLLILSFRVTIIK